MCALAGNSYAFCFDFPSPFRTGSSAHSQRKHKHCYAASSDYEHRPIFEEGHRLSTRLWNSLLSAEKERLHACLVADDGLGHLPKKSVDRSPRHKHAPADKKRSAWPRVSRQANEDSNDNTGDRYADDSDLFSFDDVPMYEDEDDDDNEADDNSDEIPKYSSFGGNNHLGRVSRNCNSGIPYLQAVQELNRVPRDTSVKEIVNSDLLTLHGSKFQFEQSNLVEVSLQKNKNPHIFMQTSKVLQQIQSSSELVSFRDAKIVKLVNGNDAYKTEPEEQYMADSQDCSHGVVTCASYDNANLPSQHDSFGDDVPSRPLGRAFNPFHFARTYNLVALRVSLAECESLAYRLKGHLLNWPRISNIARVEGDDMDWDTTSLWGGKRGRKEGGEDSLLHAIYGTRPLSGRMMEQAKSAQKLSSRRLQYLECISRPGRKALKEIKEERERQLNTSKHHQRKYYMVELGDSGGQNEEQYMGIGLPPLDSSMKQWRGPFRLLLLDPKYAGQSELPMAVQMFLNECPGHGERGPRREIVPCNLTLFYKYWSMEEIINHLLPSGETLPLPVKLLGHAAVLHLRERCSSVRFFIGKVILDKHRPKLKTVINKTEPVDDQGLPTLEVLAGNHSLVTSIIENEMQFLVNLATVHWDSELAVERQRLIQKFSNKDIVCDVYAGAGALALLSTKKVWRVFANDPNPEALKYLARNVDNNKLHAKVELYNLDSSVFLRKLLSFKRPVPMTQIVFSLPTSAETIIDALKGAFNRKTWPPNQPLPTVCVYGYSDTSHYERDFGYVSSSSILSLNIKMIQNKSIKASIMLSSSLLTSSDLQQRLLNCFL